MVLKVRLFFKDFEAFSLRDYAAIPYYMLRYALAWVWYRAIVAYRVRKFKYEGHKLKWLAIWGRHDDPTPVLCSCCLWAGPRRWVVHTYRDDGSGEDVEPVDECPKCGAEI